MSSRSTERSARPISARRAREAILRRLAHIGAAASIFAFRSIVAEGENVVVDVGDGAKRGRLIGAHYDGCTLVDNAGGMLVLLDIIRYGMARGYSFRAVFWDCEESFQQGSRSYVRQFDPPEEYVNIDGIGIRPRLVVSPPPDRQYADRLLMDSDSFDACSRYHVWSADDALLAAFRAGGYAAVQAHLSAGPRPNVEWWRCTRACMSALRRVIDAWQRHSFRAASQTEGVWMQR